ncbi:hypothetical protein GOP47_0021083 [Adiantum capillus-veneris]|uniref:Protein YIPF n=1 Tax=Adiantum capillus-veneris TaxID=13818 RepID=A0A9D4UBD5_ADICA|nr:hypothetical protein GOP47_0021083 [Adiantum capillus-veneris]
MSEKKKKRRDQWESYNNVASEGDHMVLPFPESKLQTYSPGETKGKLTGTYRPPTDADDSFSKPASGFIQEGESRGWQGFFTISRFSPYFNVDTSDVLERIRDSLLPYKGDFVEKVGHNPDIYGPFWICTTLIFVAAALGNFASYLSHKLKDEAWKYDINKVTCSGVCMDIPCSSSFLLRFSLQFQ